MGVDAIRRSGRPARLSVNNMDAAVSAAVAGLGVVRTLSYQVIDDVAAGRLERLLPDDATSALPISLLFQSGRKDHPNVRAFIKVVKRYFRGVSLS
ncbi:LysR substrate-binding domain-containing protein [Paenalcaligenes niemegkensis]|uniref:LysR substrate-binding domain-containing protein n=1 Tax=Paenalcaligenes niemegkensis TaxID=2895469 RepID=UPI00215152BA|nr:LysR substrate-binding domain-containing protein [Paenalcaligenes niemegkensis]MCQ9617858.1 LysR substrate-binding domain-containing protein [Paenalcaligenes niemegkensis]